MPFHNSNKHIFQNYKTYFNIHAFLGTKTKPRNDGVPCYKSRFLDNNKTLKIKGSQAKKHFLWDKNKLKFFSNRFCNVLGVAKRRRRIEF